MRRADALQERLHAAGMTVWQLADLLGVHEHQIDLDELPDLPVRVLHEIARRLDLHPADILRETDDLYALPRAHPPGKKPPVKKPPGIAHDALRLVNALALADRPMLPEELAHALTWPVKRVDNAAAHALAHPAIGGAVALRGEPGGYLSTSPRLDLLITSQQTELIAPHDDDTHQPGRYQRDPLTPTEAETLLAIWHTADTDHTNPLQDHALHGLINAGYVTQPGGLTLALTDDVLYSLNPTQLPDTPPRPATDTSHDADY
ncbi:MULTISPECIES: helix-turn-helix domain-containing protein [unclassified Kitasatospora]|uniref:helix-turn-helix domain-containing protein n=1 Tax=unclassified Kitasatospora TaxID=2633591 RepID=UPI00382D5270